MLASIKFFLLCQLQNYKMHCNGKSQVSVCMKIIRNKLVSSNAKPKLLLPEKRLNCHISIGYHISLMLFTYGINKNRLTHNQFFKYPFDVINQIGY